MHRSARAVTTAAAVLLTAASAQAELVGMTFFCPALGREVHYSLHLPPGEPPAGGWPLAMILHGDGRHHRTLAENPATRELIARQPMAVLCPDGGRDWWIDSPVIPESRRQAMLLELLDHVGRTQAVATSGPAVAVLEWSMGGFGAMRFALEQRERVCAVGTVMALLDFPNPALPPQSNYAIPPVLNDPACHKRFNCASNAEKLRGLPFLQLAPVDAFVFTMNRNFHARLQSLGIAHDFREVPGGHDWTAVQAALPALLDFAQKHLNRSPIAEPIDPAPPVSSRQNAP